MPVGDQYFWTPDSREKGNLNEIGFDHSAGAVGIRRSRKASAGLGAAG